MISRCYQTQGRGGVPFYAQPGALTSLPKDGMARFLPKLSGSDFPVIPLGVLLMVDLQILITTKVFIILRFSCH
jgi:hypothetical protein